MLSVGAIAGGNVVVGRAGVVLELVLEGGEEDEADGADEEVGAGVAADEDFVVLRTAVELCVSTSSNVADLCMGDVSMAG